MQVPPWQSAAQACCGSQLTTQSKVSPPSGLQLIVHGPGSQLGSQVPVTSHWKLQLVPEQLIAQSRTSLQPEWQTWLPQTGTQSGPVPGQTGVPASKGWPPSEEIPPSPPHR